MTPLETCHRLSSVGVVPCGAPLPRSNCPARQEGCPYYKPVVSDDDPMWYHADGSIRVDHMDARPGDFYGRRSDNPPEPEPELLSEDERALVSKLGQCAGDFSRITEEGPNRGNDLIEMVHHIHALQNMVLAQAAARAYPDLYRRMGASIR